MVLIESTLLCSVFIAFMSLFYFLKQGYQKKNENGKPVIKLSSLKFRPASLPWREYGSCAILSRLYFNHKTTGKWLLNK